MLILKEDEIHMKKIDKSNLEGLSKEKKELLKEHMNSASSNINLKAIREWRKYEQEESQSEIMEINGFIKMRKIIQSAMKEKGVTPDEVLKDIYDEMGWDKK